MKKALLLVICLLSFTCLKAQTTYSHGRITAVYWDSVFHDSTTCMITSFPSIQISIDSSYLGDSVKIIDTGLNAIILAKRNFTGVTPWTFTSPLSGFGTSDFNELQGRPGYVLRCNAKNS